MLSQTNYILKFAYELFFQTDYSGLLDDPYCTHSIPD